MSNPNKRKGDAAERAVLAWVRELWPDSFKTRAGFNEDLGDVIAETPNGRLVIQVKDWATPSWKQWFQQLESQVEVCRRESDRPVLGGILVWKTRGSADPATWRAITTLDKIPGLIAGTS